MKPLYKIKDTVLIKREYDLGCNSTSYFLSFTENMINTYGGTVCTITEVKDQYNHNIPTKKLDDGYTYRIKNDSGEWNWRSSMFEEEF